MAVQRAHYMTLETIAVEQWSNRQPSGYRQLTNRPAVNRSQLRHARGHDPRCPAVGFARGRCLPFEGQWSCG